MKVEHVIGAILGMNLVLTFYIARRINWLVDTGTHLIKVGQILMKRTDPRDKNPFDSLEHRGHENN